jgi:hypothetical protein
MTLCTSKLQLVFAISVLDFFLMVTARKVILNFFVPAATSSIMVIHILSCPAILTTLFGFLSLKYWFTLAYVE